MVENEDAALMMEAFKAELKECKAKIQELEAENASLKEQVLRWKTTPTLKRWLQIANSPKKIKMEMGWRSAGHVNAFLDLLCNGRLGS